MNCELCGMNKEKILKRKINLRTERYYIDGFKVKKPVTFEDKLNLGMTFIGLVLTSPFWIIPYIAYKVFINLANREIEQEVVDQVICPVCGSNKTRGEYSRVKCTVCGWYTYCENLK